jgi:hypothetical protein
MRPVVGWPISAYVGERPLLVQLSGGGPLALRDTKALTDVALLSRGWRDVSGSAGVKRTLGMAAHQLRPWGS